MKSGICVMCGEIIEYDGSKPKRYCDSCYEIHKSIKAIEHRQRAKEKQIIARRADAIAHQQDTSVWVRDYAERQKAKTLEMLGGIKDV